MLQIINAGSPDVMLNNWEKTSPIIKELEQTVNFAERKYGDLMQQLNFYKQYWSQHEKFSNKSEVRIQRKTKRKNKNVIVSNSSSDSDTKQEPQRINQHFYEKLRNKISKINNEITEANKKLGLKPAEETKENNLPPDDSREAEEPEKEEFPNKTTKSEPALAVEKKSSFTKMCQKSSTKSIPLKATNFKKRHVPLLRRRHSSLQPYKIRSKSLPQGVRRKFGFGSFVEVNEPGSESFKKPDVLKPKKPSTERIIKKASFKTRKPKVFPTKINKSNMEIPSKKEIPRRKAVSQNNIPLPKEVKKPIKISPRRDFSRNRHVEGTSKTKIEDFGEDFKISEKQNRNFERKPSTIISLAKQPIPFTICASTSKSFNLGLNIQQVLSMVKRKKRSLTLQEILKDNIQTTRSVLEKKEPEIDTLFLGKPKSRFGSEICPAREENEDCLSCITDRFETRSRCTILSKARSQTSERNKIKSLIDPNSVPKFDENIEKIERPEDVWVVEQPDSNSACRTKSKCTCFPSKQCLDYNKVIKQYTGWRLPIAKSEILNADFCGARFTFNGNQLYPIPSQENIYQFPRTINGNQNGVKAELMKLQNDLMNLHRKYGLLQEKMAQSDLDDLEAQAELDAMESEINSREAEYKDIISFYSQLLSLKERLKFLRGKNNGSVSLSVIQHRSRKDPLRPTPSMALTKVLRQIQCLQDKIKLTDIP